MLGLFCGMVGNLGAYHWCQQLMDTYTSFGVLSWLVLVLVCAYQAIPLGAWCWLLRNPRKPCSRSHWCLDWLYSVTAFVALEHFHPVFFPLYLSTSQHSNSFTFTLVEWGGMSALSLFLVSVNLALANAMPANVSRPKIGPMFKTVWPLEPSRKNQVLLGHLGMVLLLSLVCSSRRSQIEQRIQEAPTLGMGLVQANHWIDDKDPLSALHDYQSLSLELIEQAQRGGRRLDLLIWPESAVRTPPPMYSTKSEPSVLRSGSGLSYFPLDLAMVSPGESIPASTLSKDVAARDELFSLQRGHRVPLLFGTSLEDQSESAVPAIAGRPALYNSAVLLDEKGAVRGKAAKVKLMMFGESIPFSGTFPQLYELIPVASALLAGEQPEVLSLGDVRLGIMICYEDVLPTFHRALAAKRPQILVNLTNDAWFGKTKEGEAHLGMAKFRAAEARACLVRVTSTGWTSVVDAHGDVVASLAQDTRGTIHQEVPILDIDTLFEKWGNWVAWCCLLVALLLELWERAPRPRGKRSA